nr:MAG TPA_asm: hypothetical protein [Caudoviricetes sp.]
MEPMDIFIVVGIIAAVIAGIRWSDKQAKDWVRIIEMMNERERETQKNEKGGGDTNGEKGSGAVHRRMRADQRDGKGH